ncbi:MAG TPA: response regulator transcription factor [Coleofasciculaceae cyanobacterium]
MNRKILIVDDDPHIREVIRFALEKAGMSVAEAGNGQEGLRQIQVIQPDLVVLDIIMPEMDGLEMCRELRKNSELPILFLSSRDDEIDRIIGLELGGDDYVTKPFSPRELVARVNVILKRLNRPEQPGNGAAKVYCYGQARLEIETHQAFWKEQSVILTATEFNLLEIMLRHPGRVYSRDDLIESDVFSDVVTDRTVDSHIRRLRGKYAEAGAETLIETVHGVGYKLGSCE